MKVIITCLLYLIVVNEIIGSFIIDAFIHHSLCSQKITHTPIQRRFGAHDDNDEIAVKIVIEREVGEIIKSLSQGLNKEEVKHKLNIYGRNVVTPPERRTSFRLFLDQFDDRLVQILVVVAAISCVSSLSELTSDSITLESFIEPLVIILILIINASVGLWQQLSAIISLEALKELQPKLSTVVRENDAGKNECITDFDASMIVPGDIIRIKVGDIIPADALITNLIGSSDLTVDESTLTGESVPVEKYPLCEIMNEDKNFSLEKHAIFSGTTVTKGAVQAIVVKTGSHTQVGQIQTAVANVEVEKTPLNQQLDEFGNNLALIIAGICVAVWTISIPRFDDPFFRTTFDGGLYYAKVGVALGVAAIPEGLPAVITLVLALGVRRLAEQNVIVRNLASVETLGCVNVIATDKTGTLTTNQMTVVSLVMIERVQNNITSVEHNFDGNSFDQNGQEVQSLPDGAISDTISVSIGCNDAEVIVDENGKYSTRGDPTEGSLIILARNLEGLKTDQEEGSKQSSWNDRWDKYATLDFDRKRKSMSVLCRNKASKMERLLVKGAPDSLLNRCSNVKLRDGDIVELTPELRMDVESAVQSMSSRPLRCLLLAVKEVRDVEYKIDFKNEKNYKSIESGLTLISITGIKDPVRKDALESIKLCKEAGIRVIMITGDAKSTAKAIGEELEIISNGINDKSQVFEADEFFSKTEEEQEGILSNDNLVLARIGATDKQLILRMLQARGDIPAMSGDGVNDAAALRQANIGIAMGSGTDIAKEAGDMILVDDSFGTIVRGVQEGRCIYENIQAFIKFLISSNIGEVIAVFLTTISGLPNIITAIQLLWVNLITDGPPAIALGWNPPDDTVMKKSPRDREASIVNSWTITRYFLIGTYIGLSTVGIFVTYFLDNEIPIDLLSRWTECTDLASDMSICDAFSHDAMEVPQTLALTTLVTTEMLNALSSVSLDTSLLKTGLQRNPRLLLSVIISLVMHVGIMYSGRLGVPAIAHSFGLVPLSIEQWETVLLWSMPILAVDESLKFYSRRNK